MSRKIYNPEAIKRHRELNRWTPKAGMIRALIHGTIAAVILSIILSPIAVYAPYLMWNLLIRSILAFAVFWILIGVVQDASGMVGIFSTAWAIMLTSIVLLSNHVVVAVMEVEMVSRSGEIVPSEAWLNIAVIGIMNWIPSIIVGIGAYLCHPGVPGGSTIADICTVRFWWGGIGW